MAEEYFVDFELEDDIIVDESDLWGYTTDEEICLINKGEESPVLESIPITEAGEVEITFVEESMVKKMTIDDGNNAAESSKRKKHQCERCGITYVRWDFYHKHISGTKVDGTLEFVWTLVFSLAWLLQLHA